MKLYLVLVIFVCICAVTQAMPKPALRKFLQKVTHRRLPTKDLRGPSSSGVPPRPSSDEGSQEAPPPRPSSASDEDSQEAPPAPAEQPGVLTDACYEPAYTLALQLETWGPDSCPAEDDSIWGLVLASPYILCVMRPEDLLTGLVCAYDYYLSGELPEYHPINYVYQYFVQPVEAFLPEHIPESEGLVDLVEEVYSYH